MSKQDPMRHFASSSEREEAVAVRASRRQKYPSGSVVYFVAIGDCVKIGFSTNMKARMKTFRTSSADIQLLLAIPGDRALEREMHTLFDEQRIERELFHLEGRVADFLDWHIHEGFDRAMELLKTSAPSPIRTAFR